MKIIDLLNIKSKNEIMPKLIKIMWLDYEVKYYLDEEFWYRDIRDSEPLRIKPSQLNIEVEILEDKPKEIEKLEKTDVHYDNPLNMMSYVKKEYEHTKENICDKLNEVIDKLNYLLEKSDKDE